jgi:hypothetical protein
MQIKPLIFNVGFDVGRNKRKGKKKKTTSSKSSEPGAKTLTGNPICIIRESNAGLIDGNDEFYH